MKRIVTLFFLTLGVLSAPMVHAQGVHVAHLVGSAQIERPQSSGLPFVNPGSFAKFGAPQAARRDTLLAYFDPDSLYLYNWYYLPSAISLHRTADQGGDTVDLITAYAERFSSTYTRTYLDSVTILFGFTKFDAGQNGDNRVLIEARKTFNSPSSGDPLIDFGQTTRLDSAVILPDDFELNAANFVTFPMNHKNVGKSFGIAIQVVDTTATQMAIRGDSVQGRDFDVNLDRAYWKTGPYGTTSGYENYMAGVSYGGGDPFFPNFIIIAHVSDQLAGVDENGKPTLELNQNYPNSFSSITEISYSLPQSQPVRLTVYGPLGQQIETLVNGVEGAGDHNVQFDGSKLASGTYFYTLNAGNTVLTRSMKIVR